MTHNSESPAVNWQTFLRVLCWPNNLVTLGRVLVVAAVVLPLFVGWEWPPVLGSIVFCAAFWWMDNLDGWLARRLGRGSSFGESLDLMADAFCDLLLCSTMLVARPEHTVAVMIFLLGRLGPDVVVTRFAGLRSGIYSSMMNDVAPEGLRHGKRAMDWVIEAYCLSKTIFFCGALFWHFPAWTGFLIVVPAAIFVAVALGTMRLHVAQILAERAEKGLEP